MGQVYLLKELSIYKGFIYYYKEHIQKLIVTFIENINTKDITNDYQIKLLNHLFSYYYKFCRKLVENITLQNIQSEYQYQIWCDFCYYSANNGMCHDPDNDFFNNFITNSDLRHVNNQYQVGMIKLLFSSTYYDYNGYLRSYKTQLQDLFSRFNLNDCINTFQTQLLNTQVYNIDYKDIFNKYVDDLNDDNLNDYNKEFIRKFKDSNFCRSTKEKIDRAEQAEKELYLSIDNES